MKLDKELSKYYYTTAQARKRLGLDEEAFQYWVRRDRIKKVVLPGRVQGVYSRREVDSLADQITATVITEKPEGIEFRKATPDDMEEEYNLSYLIFGKAAHSIETRLGFLLKNLDTYYHLYDREKLVAAIQVIPFNQETITKFMSGQIRGWEIDPKNVEKFTPGKPLECIFMEMITTPTVPPKQRSVYGAQLLLGFSRMLTEWGEHGIIIKKFHATSSTPTGIHILSTAGFEIVRDLGRGRFAFELDIKTSDAKIIRNYREALKEWEAKQQKTPRKRTTPTTTAAEAKV